MAGHFNIGSPGEGGRAQEPLQDVQVDQILDVGERLFSQGERFLRSLVQEWNFYQVVIAIGIFILAYLLRVWLGPAIRAWMGNRENWPKWRIRILVVIHQRLQAIFFVALIWATVFLMRELTWDFRSALLTIVATLATAWVFIVFVTRLIKSPVLRKFVRYGAWTRHAFDTRSGGRS